jgi:hypothetical protein
MLKLTLLINVIGGMAIVRAWSVECGVWSGERGFLILIFKNFDNHGEGDLLPWIMNIWILENSWISGYRP